MVISSPRAQKPRISIIVACAANRVIGAGGKMPWHLPEDLRRFKQITMGHTIVMGRKTWESIGRLLPGRRHVIITRQPGYGVAGATVVHSIDAAISAAGDDREIFIIGGSEIYALALPETDRILLTEIKKDFEGDTYFPGIASGEWREIGRANMQDNASGMQYDFVTMERIKSP